MDGRSTGHGLILVGLLLAITFVFEAEVNAVPVENSIGREVSLVGVGAISGDAKDLSGLNQTLTPAAGTSNDEVSPDTLFTNNMLGGISAIAWTGEEDLYWCLPDRGPLDGAVNWNCRIHKIRITASSPNRQLGNRQAQVKTQLVSTVLLRDKQGNPFTGLASAFQATAKSARRLDPEGVRVGSNGNLFISDEYGPRLIEFTPNGQMVRELKMPGHLTAAKPGVSYATENPHNVSGRPSNRGMEGLAISPDRKHLFGLMQSPLLQDSFRQKLTDRPSGICCRIPVFETSGTFCNEYFYPLDDCSNGLNEIIAYDEDRFITIERDGKAGVEAQCKKLMLISLSNASNILGVEKLPPNELPKAFREVQKEVLVDLLDPKWNLAGQQMPEKIEGLAFGPNFPNGDRLLLVASDNDFISESPTEFFMFRVPKNKPPMARSAENQVPQETLSASR